MNEEDNIVINLDDVDESEMFTITLSESSVELTDLDMGPIGEPVTIDCSGDNVTVDGVVVDFSLDNEEE